MVCVFSLCVSFLAINAGSNAGWPQAGPDLGRSVVRRQRTPHAHSSDALVGRAAAPMPLGVVARGGE